MRKGLIILLALISLTAAAQKTWYGEVALYGGGGTNDIFRFHELEGAGSYNGTGTWGAGIDFRRIFSKHFSLESGIGYWHQYYYVSPAPGIPGDDHYYNFGMIAIPVTARVDFLKFFFIDGGILAGIQPVSSYADNMTGLGFTVGAGAQYKFKSDIFIRVRAAANQYALLHFMPEDYPQTLDNSCFTISAGYEFIKLGKCNCPEDNSPKRKFF